MANYSNNLFVGQKIQLDGHTFTNNTFQNCVLVYGGGPLRMVGNSLTGVQWEFVDAAARTVGLISSFYQSGGDSKHFVERLLFTDIRSDAIG
jgi:hypothetical protein